MAVGVSGREGGPTSPRPGADRGPTGPRPLAVCPRPIAVIPAGIEAPLCARGRSGRRGRGTPSRPWPSQSSSYAKPRAHPVDQQVLHLHEPRQVALQLGVPPAQGLPDLPPRQPDVAPGHGTALGGGRAPSRRGAGAAAWSAAAARPAIAPAPRGPAGWPPGCRPPSPRCTRGPRPGGSTVCSSRWCWWSRVTARMSVRYFMWSRRIRVRASLKVSRSA